jgi:DNA-binding MarR family transcriptional regulator
VFRALGPLYRLAARKVAADESIEHVSTGVRAVLERLGDAGPEPVPALARALAISRQFTQRMVDDAAAAGYVELAPNPVHRRSSLVVLSPAGRDAIDRITRREAELLGATPGDLTGEEVDACLRVLRQLLALVGDLAEGA